jgi:nitrite reductase/ring-hydroxylating ferredoxin subunit
MNQSEIELGPLEAFTQFPTEITLEDTLYWLTRTSAGEFRLFLALCPHAGGEIRPLDDILFCPLHFWTFNAEDGTCLNDSDERLMQRKVQVRDNLLYAVGENH